MIFCDFDGFPQISQFLHTVLIASRRRIGSKCVHFHGFGGIRAIFGSKSTQFRRLGQSVTGTWPEALRLLISRFSTVFEHCFERFQVANGIEIAK